MKLCVCEVSYEVFYIFCDLFLSFVSSVETSGFRAEGRSPGGEVETMADFLLNLTFSTTGR